MHDGRWHTKCTFITNDLNLSLSQSYQDQLFTQMQTLLLFHYLCFCHCRRSETPFYTARHSISPSTISVSATAEDQRLRSTLPDTPFLLPPSLFLPLQKIRDSVLHCQTLHFSFHHLCFCHCRRSETPFYTARHSISPSTISVFLPLQKIRDSVLHCQTLLFLLPPSLFLPLQKIRDSVLHCQTLLFLLPPSLFLPLQKIRDN